MQIQTENQLVAELAKGLKKTFHTDIAIQEFSAGYGIADLAFAKNFFTNNNSINRKPINNYYALKSFLLLPNDTLFTVEDVIRISGTSKYISREIIRLLAVGDYIVKDGRKYFKKVNTILNPIKKLIAIEAKIKDWKQGVLQARRYKSYTDECYLAILSNYETNIDYSYLDKHDIGLILFNQKNGEIYFKRKPSQNSFLSFYEESMGLFAKELFLHQVISLKFH